MEAVPRYFQQQHAEIVDSITSFLALAEPLEDPQASGQSFSSLGIRKAFSVARVSSNSI
jgi:hypothetical protein